MQDDKWFDLIHNLRSKLMLLRPGLSSMMGYPIHGRTSNTSPGPDWLSLFTLGSDDNLSWSWCDGQHLDVYIHVDSLKNRTFERVYGYAS